MAKRSAGPFSAVDLARWNKDLATLERARQEIEMAREAGFPCDEQDEACRAMRDQIMRMKKVYFPDQP